MIELEKKEYIDEVINVLGVDYRVYIILDTNSQMYKDNLSDDAKSARDYQKHEIYISEDMMQYLRRELLYVFLYEMGIKEFSDSWTLNKEMITCISALIPKIEECHSKINKKYKYTVVFQFYKALSEAKQDSKTTHKEDSVKEDSEMHDPKDRCMYCKEMFDDGYCAKSRKFVTFDEFYRYPYKPKWCAGRVPSDDYHDIK